MNKVKKPVIANIVFNLIALISTALALVFCMYIYKLDMIPNNYLKLAFIGIGIIYLILISLTLPRKMSKIVKGICCFFFIVNAFIFGYGIKYTDKTISVLDKISYDLAEKEFYELKVLGKSDISSKEDLIGKKIGVFKNDSYDNVVKYLKKDVDCELIDYDDPVKFFEDLSNGVIDGVISSGAVYSLLEEDLSYMKLEVKTVHVIEIPIEGNTNEIVKVVDVTNTPFNIFLAGGDRSGYINKSRYMNTDVNMIISVDPVNRKLLLTSIPRDYYVNLASKNAYDKLTHAGYYGVQESVKTVEELLDIDINYYVKVNFTTVEKIVDAIGGVDINNERSFSSGKYHYKKGKLHLDGKEALQYSRERKSFSDGDVTRVQHQQKVLDAIIKKVSSSKTILLSYTDLLEAISENLATNMDRASISRLVKMQLSDMKAWQITSQHLNGKPDATYGCYSIPKYYLYIMRQDKNSIKKNKDAIDAFFAGRTLLEKQEEETVDD